MSYPPPPPPPHHGMGSPQMSQQQHPYPPSPFEQHIQMHNDYDNRGSMDDYHNGTAMGWQHNSRGSMSDVKLTGHYDSDDEDMMVPREKQRRSCLDKICCGCCTCCPKWARYCSCVLLLILIAIGIVVGVLAALFKKPEVNFNGLQGDPQVSMEGTNISMNFSLAISVNNPNVESVTFEKIVAKAYYPDHHDVSIGGGEKDDVHIAKEAVTNITFPFSIEVNAVDSNSQAIVQDLMTKCGLTGGQKQQLTIDYDVVPTIKIIGIPISFTISNSANFDCPLDSSALTSGGGLASLLPGGSLPSGL